MKFRGRAQPHGVAPQTLGWLQQWGYDLVRWPDRHMFFGGVHALGIDTALRCQTAGDPRRGGAIVQMREETNVKFHRQAQHAPAAKS